VRLELQRGVGDCGLCALATFAELSYEDVFVVAAKVDRKHRGKSGVQWTDLKRIARALGFTPRLRLKPALEDDEGLLMVTWQPGSKHYVASGGFRQHLVALAHGVIADPADGMILPADEYLARAVATAGALLELR
jgi:hypothetical protein